MTEPFTAHLGLRDLYTTSVADDTTVADSLVFAAVAIPILYRTEDTLAKQTISLGFERTIVDRLRLRDFTM